MDSAQTRRQLTNYHDQHHVFDFGWPHGFTMRLEDQKTPFARDSGSCPTIDPPTEAGFLIACVQYAQKAKAAPWSRATSRGMSVARRLYIWLLVKDAPTRDCSVNLALT